jgi:MFS family permease
MLALGIGGGITFNPILLAAMSGVQPNEAGLASGIVNTSFMFGGALGLAILASAAASRTESLANSGHGALEALNGGYHLAFVIGAGFAVLAAVVAAVLIKAEAPAGAHAVEPVPAE